jgi:hypothetical protein
MRCIMRRLQLLVVRSIAFDRIFLHMPILVCFPVRKETTRRRVQFSPQVSRCNCQTVRLHDQRIERSGSDLAQKRRADGAPARRPHHQHPPVRHRAKRCLACDRLQSAPNVGAVDITPYPENQLLCR